MCTIVEYYHAFMKAGLENDAPNQVIERIRNLYVTMNEDAVWKAPEQLQKHCFDIKVSLAMIVQDHAEGHEAWYKAMKSVFETMQLDK